MQTALQRAFHDMKVTKKTNRGLAMRVLDGLERKVADDRRKTQRKQAVRRTPQQ